jgi:hypothetical protein
MCFSASASFGLGITLSAIGVVCIKKVKIQAHYFFASIPLIFSIQQLSEGFLWLALSTNVYAPLENVSMYTYLFFAQVVWPFWIPFSIYMIEDNKKTKYILRFLLTCGIIVSLYLAYCLLSYKVTAQIIGRHINYDHSYPLSFYETGVMLYLAATILPPWFSSLKKARILSIAILISYIMSMIFYREFVVSVWCFFAAGISAIIFYILNDLNPSTNNNELR